MKIKASGRLLPVLLALAALAVTVSVTSASADGHRGKSDRVRSKDDGVQSKLTSDLQQKVNDEATGKVAVVVAMKSGDVAQATKMMDETHVASKSGVALVVGQVNATKLSKLAGLDGVVSVSSIQFKQTGTPTGTDPEIGNQHDRKTRNEALRAFQKTSVPFDKAPPLKTSNFDQLKSMDVLDAKTHNFTGAWKAGYTGTGVTASVLDGGTDWGHPDLIGTWQTWTQDDVTNFGADPGWVGWPKAFDPYSTLVLLAAPDMVAAGPLLVHADAERHLHLRQEERQADRPAPRQGCALPGQLRHADRPGAQLLGAGRHERPHLHVPGELDEVRHGQAWRAIPTTTCSSCTASARPFLVTDPTTAGSYDTVYVDLTTTTRSPTRSRSRRARRSRTAT